MPAMVPVTLRSSAEFATGILRRYVLSFGQGMLLIFVALAVFFAGDDWKYGFILWGLVSAQTCLIGCWVALAERPWLMRLVYGGLHLLGLMFCVLVAGQMHPRAHRAPNTLIDILRDVPAMLVSALAAGLILRCRRWRLSAGVEPDRCGTSLSARRMQIPLGEFIKWFTLLCIVLGLSVSLLPPASLLRDHWLWHTRVSDYLAFFLVVCLPGAVVANRIFLQTLKSESLNLRQTSWAAIVWSLATVLWIGVVLIAFNLVYNVYYLSYYLARPPTIPPVEIPSLFVRMETIGYWPVRNAYWALGSLLAAVFVVAIMARLAGWRTRRIET
jgi:hypothetical protein